MTAGGSIENVPALIERRYKSGLSGELFAGAGEAF
jgi:hypothetical protein